MHTGYGWRKTVKRVSAVGGLKSFDVGDRGSDSRLIMIGTPVHVLIFQPVLSHGAIRCVSLSPS